jgi:hypothetical protein
MLDGENHDRSETVSRISDDSKDVRVISSISSLQRTVADNPTDEDACASGPRSQEQNYISQDVVLRAVDVFEPRS